MWYSLFIQYLPDSKISIIKTFVLFDLKVFFAWFAVFSFFFLNPFWIAGSLVCFVFVSVKLYVIVFKSFRRCGRPEGPAAATPMEASQAVENTLS